MLRPWIRRKSTLVAASLLVSCGSGRHTVVSSGLGAPTAESPSKTPVKVHPDRVFETDLFANIVADAAGGENVAFSPVIIRGALAMLHRGARGQTATEIGSVLQLGEDTRRFHREFSALLAEWRKLEPNVTIGAYRFPRRKQAALNIAFGAFANAATSFEPAYREMIQQEYAADWQRVDFEHHPDQATLAMNQWATTRTNGLIQSAAPEGALSSLTRLVLLGAVYFWGPWETPFKRTATKPQPFRLRSGESVQVPMMRITEHLPYGRFQGLSVLRLPYQDGGLAMEILLTDKADALPELQRRMTAANLTAWLRDLEVEEVAVELPRFRIKWGSSLRKTLERLGARRLFRLDEADLTGISPDPVAIDEILHSAVVNVSEEGTEAAAVGSVIAWGADEPEPEPKPFVVDHPFIFIIRDVERDRILFMGQVTDPRGDGA